MAAKKKRVKKSATRASKSADKLVGLMIEHDRALASMRPGEGTYQPTGGTGIIRPG